MKCSICDHHETRFYCVPCLRERIRRSFRYELVELLLEKQELGKQAREQLTLPAHRALRRARGVERGMHRLQELQRWVTQVHKEMQNTRGHCEEKRGANRARRERLGQARHELRQGQPLLVEGVEQDTQRLGVQWQDVTGRLVDLRRSLCTEVAGFHGLSKRRRRRNGALMEEYLIGDCVIADFADMEVWDPGMAATGLSRFAHLLALFAYYLGIHIPYRISLPVRASTVCSVEGQELMAANKAELLFTGFTRAATMLLYDAMYVAFSQHPGSQDTHGWAAEPADEPWSKRRKLNLGHILYELVHIHGRELGQWGHESSANNLFSYEGLQRMEGWTLSLEDLEEEVRASMRQVENQWDVLEDEHWTKLKPKPSDQ